MKIFKLKKVIFRKPKRFDQSYLEAWFEIPDITLTAPNYSVENFKFCQGFIYNFFQNFFSKNHKKRQILETKNKWAVRFG